MYLIYLLLEILLTTFLNQESISDHYNCLKLLNPQIKEGPWVLEQYLDIEEFDLYLYFMKQQDTIYNLSYYVKKKDLKLCPNDFLISRFRKRYSDQDFKYVLCMNTDTLYFYKYPIGQPDRKNFEVGKYYYMFTNLKEFEDIKECQVRFFFQHTDSLRKIRGNCLPELPCDY